MRRTDHVVVACAGVGYRLAVSSETLRHTPAVGNPATLHTHLIVRDDALQLYGFASEAERDLFLMLIGVQSVGPEGGAGGAQRRHAARAARRRGGGRHGAAAGRAGDRQAHGGADRRRAAREGRRRARGRPDRRSPAATTRGCWPATGSSASATPPPEAEQLLEGAEGDTTEALIAHALKVARR